ncbi:MAG: hypothetical protein KAG98_03810, partial [Lentisphaeria bacterium]|nr:hypothetical protein [Lentisphaeria bacterium]
MNSPKKLPIYLSIISIVLVCLVIFNLKQDTSINPTLDAKVTALAPTEKTVKKQQLPVPTQDKRILPRTLVSNTYPNKVTNPGAIVLNESNASHSLLSFNLPSFSIQEVTTKSGQIFTQVTSERGAKNLNRKGYPALPRYKQQLLVPKDCAIELITNKLAYTTHTIGTLLPGSGPISRSQKRPEPTCGDFYNSQESYPKAPIFISDSFEFRNMRAITITINPFIFDAATQSLRIYNKLDFEIRTSGGKLLLENPPAVADFQTRASESFINYPQAT